MFTSRKTALALLVVLLVSLSANVLAEGLPMDNFSAGPKPAQENYIAADEYQDSSISVKIYTDRFADTT